MDDTQKDDQLKAKIAPSQPQTQPQTGRGLGEKEKEAAGVGKEVIREVGKEIEPAKELKEAGVKLRKEEIKLPPPVEKLGIKPTGPAAVPPPPAVSLPLSDDQIVTGLTSPILSSLRWLAEFCFRQLKKAHLGLRGIHGKIIRVKE